MKKRFKLLASFFITIAFLVQFAFVSAADRIDSGLTQVDNNIILINNLFWRSYYKIEF